MGKLDWIKFLSGLLSKKTLKAIGTAFVFFVIVTSHYFPVWYTKWGGIASNALMEQYKKDILEKFQPLIDHYNK